MAARRYPDVVVDGWELPAFAEMTPGLYKATMDFVSAYDEAQKAQERVETAKEILLKFRP